MSSCCGGNCGCGASCKCGNGCGGCKMYPDMTHSEKTTTETLVLGVAPPQKTYAEGEEMEVAAKNGACKCSPCTCDPCNCK